MAAARARSSRLAPKISLNLWSKPRCVAAASAYKASAIKSCAAKNQPKTLKNKPRGRHKFVINGKVAIKTGRSAGSCAPGGKTPTRFTRQPERRVGKPCPPPFNRTRRGVTKKIAPFWKSCRAAVAENRAKTQKRLINLYGHPTNLSRA